MRHAETCELVQPSSIVAGMHRAHQARQRRIKAAAVGQHAIEVAKIDDEQVDILEKRWAERQRENWFSIVEETTPYRPSIACIQAAAITHFGLSRAEFFSERRTHDVVVPRQIAMYLAKIFTIRSLPEIGRRFGGKDHTTVLHAVRKIESLIKTDWLIAYDVAHVEAML
jgi:chromosomal replication initiation ATPase DnaA